jgi:hypothetical protein
VQIHPIRNLAPFSRQDQAQPTSCGTCKSLDEHLLFLGQWIKETENPKLKKQLEKTIEALKGTAILHKLEQHSSLHMPHPVRSGLGQPTSYSRSRIQTLAREKALILAKGER